MKVVFCSIIGFVFLTKFLSSGIEAVMDVCIYNAGKCFHAVKIQVQIKQFSSLSCK